jgi:hypothetical protein
MLMDAEIKRNGYKILSKELGLLEAERFICLIQRDSFDYTQWRQTLFDNQCGEDISRKAMEYRTSKAQ